MSPIPMTNPIPTVGILIFVVATLEADGVVMILGYVVTRLITGIFGLASYLLRRSPELFLRWFGGT